jgi:hypothetical protein
MSRLLDHQKNAERKRRDLREGRSGTPDSAVSLPDIPRPAAPAEAQAAAAAGERRQLALARISGVWRRLSRPLVLLAVAFAIGFGASALWLQPAAPNGKASFRAPAAAQPEPPARQAAAVGALQLKIDADAAGFAARAASTGRR